MGERFEVTPKQSAFVDEYLIDLNATQAAIRAGYKGDPDTIGPRLLGYVGVQEAIAEKQKERQQRTEITQDVVLRDIEAIKRSAMTMTADKDGNPVMVNYNAALKACELQGRHNGMFTDKMALTIETTTDEELHARIADLARKAGITSAAG